MTHVCYNTITVASVASSCPDEMISEGEEAETEHKRENEGDDED